MLDRLFRRGRVPDWAADRLTREEYRVFRRLTEDAFRRRRATFRYIERFGVVTVDLGGEHSGELQLSNLVLRLDGVPAGGWPAIVDTHIDTLLSIEPGRAVDYEEEAVRVKLYPSGGLDSSRLVVRELSPGIEARLVAHVGANTRIVFADDVGHWPVSADIAWDKALANSVAEPIHRRTTMSGDVVVMEEVLADHPYVATHVLALPALLGPDPRGGLVAVPNQHHLLFVRETDHHDDSLDEIASLAQGLFDIGPHPISPEPFLWDGSTLVPVRR